MWLADKSSVHNCGRNILSSIFDLRQSNNIKHWRSFCAQNLVARVGRAFYPERSEGQPVGFVVSDITNRNPQAEACATT
jgi:hypothetical protein